MRYALPMNVTPFHVLLVALGGGLGSALRFLGGDAAQRFLPAAAIPAGTLAVNVVGSLLIGLIGGYAEGRSAVTPEARLFLLTGLLGGFTTFSAFAWETLGLGLQGAWWRALLNVAVQLVLGLGAAAAGYFAGRAF